MTFGAAAAAVGASAEASPVNLGMAVSEGAPSDDEMDGHCDASHAPCPPRVPSHNITTLAWLGWKFRDNEKWERS